MSYVEKCIHLGNTLNSSSIEHAMLDSANIDLNIKTNYLLSFSESIKLSYSLNVYGSPLWKYNNHKYIERFCIAWRKAIQRLWKISYRTHNALVHLKFNSISIILEIRCVKFLWNLLNSDNVLFRRICRYSIHNSNKTIGENIRYFIYKYNI